MSDRAARQTPTRVAPETPVTPPVALPPLDALLTELASRIADQVVARLAPPSAPEVTPSVVSKSALALVLGVSVATLDRLAREGMPYESVGARRRYDVAACRSWLASRGKRAARVPPRRPDAEDDDVDVTDVLRRAKLQVVRGTR